MYCYLANNWLRSLANSAVCWEKPNWRGSSTSYWPSSSTSNIHHLAYSARADLCRRLERIVDGRVNKVYLYVFLAIVFLQAWATYLERVNPSWWQAATQAILKS